MNNPRRIQRHLVKALAAGSLLVAAALPLAIATVASAAAGSLTSIAFTPHGTASNAIGAGSSGTAVITGVGFADNGATNDTLVATCSGTATVTFQTGSIVETSSTSATANFAGAVGTAGTCSLVLTDANGSTAPLANAIIVDAAPTISSISPSTVWEGSAATTVTITGSNFATPTVTFANGTDGTSLTSSVTSSTATSIVLSVTPTNPANSGPASTGAFQVTVTNPDGGAAATSLSVNSGLEIVSPSATSVAGNIALTLQGSGFQYGATLSLNTYAGSTYTEDTGACAADITNSGTTPVNGIDYVVSGFTVTSPTTATLTLPVTAVTAARCAFTVTNTGAGNNGAVTELAAAFGLGESSGVAPIVTSVSPTTAIVVGSPAVATTLTGAGFSTYTALTGAPTDVAYSTATGSTGTTLTFNVTVSSGVTAGSYAVTAGNNGQTTTLPAAVTVAGPAIASQAPNLVENAPFGTTVTLTGTGFTNTTTGTVTAGGTGLGGSVTYVSPTTLSLVVTTSPNTGTYTGATVALSQVTSTGTVITAPFAITIDAPPAVTGPVTYKVGADVGVGATAQTVTIHGQGFATGATVTAFVNAAAVADPNVTATVTAVTATTITATIAVKAPDTNTTVGYTVTNTDGGSTKVAAFSYPIFIGAGPTITSVTPAAGAAAATTSFAIAGTGFAAGAVATLTPANGTCGATTVSASTTLAVTCTLGAAGVTPTSLVVTNPDGGSVTSAPVLAAETAPAFHVSGVHGAAVVGKTVTVTITGTGFYGQPKITSAGFKFGVTKDSGSVLTVRVTASASAKSGEHSLTVILANGKSGKAGFNTKK